MGVILPVPGAERRCKRGEVRGVIDTKFVCGDAIHTVLLDIMDFVFF